MNKLIFERCNIAEMNTVREPSRIVFELEPNLTLSEFSICCKRLAHAMGYDTASVVKAFGPDKEVGNPTQLKMLLK
mgnify:CR=1 FL=1|tara:strand:+ start:1350 stop:1577 length:228 start_codon:yes stop_codon:yes gene_type:complete